MTKQAILFLATGSATSPEHVEEFLLDIREGRAPSPELLEEIRGRYQVIGCSPFVRITLRQANALQQELARRGVDVPVVPGMCHCEPRIRDAVKELKSEGVTRATAIILAPLQSSFNKERYVKRLHEAQPDPGTRIEMDWVESWWQEPKFIQAWTSHIRKAVAADSAGRTKLLFTAHSLPIRAVTADDPYPGRLKTLAARLAGELGITDWDTAFQSAGASPEPWLGPSLKDSIPLLAKAGYSRIVVAPVGFVCDNVEILYDIDVEAKELARRHGLRLDRAEMMNTEPLFIEALADAIGKVLA